MHCCDRSHEKNLTEGFREDSVTSWRANVHGLSQSLSEISRDLSR